MSETRTITVSTGGHEVLNRAVQAIAFEKGYRWFGRGGLPKDFKYLGEAHIYFFKPDGDIGYTASPTFRHTPSVEMSLVEFAKTPNWTPPAPPIEVCDHKITFNPNGSLELDCGDAISSKTVQAIIDRRAEVMTDSPKD